MQKTTALGGMTPADVPASREVMIGTITIGQAPRSDIVPLIDAMLPDGTTCIHVGVLDGLSREEITERFTPRAGDDLLTSKLLDGSSVVMGKIAVRQGLEDKIAFLEDTGCSIIVILCTGEFEGLRSQKAKLIEPDHVVPPVVTALTGHGKLGVMVPLLEQAQSEKRKWVKTGQELVFADASPYTASAQEIQRAAKDLAKQGVDLIVLDCMGYRLEHKKLCQAVVDCPVMASTDTMINVLRALL